MCAFSPNWKKKKVVSSTDGVKIFCIVSFLNILFHSQLFEFLLILKKKEKFQIVEIVQHGNLKIKKSLAVIVI